MSKETVPFIIGLTGNIATGKSVVLKMAAEKGALTLDADKIVHDILENDPSMQAAIAVAFGPQVRRKDGAIDRGALAAIVFADETALRDLETLVHPAVRREIQGRIAAAEAPVVMIEAIKLLEGELAAFCDEIWVTRCPRTLQEQRLTICRGLDAETARMRIAAQNPQEAKLARADVVIDTDGPLAHTRTLFERAWQRTPQTAPPAAKPPASALAPEPAPVSTDSAHDDPARRADEPEGVLIRRARPSDIPALMLLMRQAGQAGPRQTRAEMLRSFAERSYLMAQIHTGVVAVVGWNTDSTTAVCVDHVVAHPAQAIDVVGRALLREIERSAHELICEVVLVFLGEGAPPQFEELLRSAGYAEMQLAQMRRAWRRVVEERRPQGSVIIMGKVLRDIRVV